MNAGLALRTERVSQFGQNPGPAQIETMFVKRSTIETDGGGSAGEPKP
jgi:hypothetical protein